MVENKNFVWKEIKLYAVYRNMKGCILEANLQGQERQSRMFTILLILTWEFRQQKKRRQFWKLFCLGGGQMTYLGESIVCLGGPSVGGNYKDCL